MNPSFCEDDCDTDYYYYYYYYVGVGVVFSSRLDGDEHTCRSCLVLLLLLLLLSSFSTTCSCIFSRTKPREVFSPISSFHREAWSSVVSRSAKPRVARGKTTFPICFVSYNFIFLLWRFVPKNKRDYSFCVTDCLYYELCPKHSILRPNNALFLCFFRIKNFYSCVLVTDYSIIKRNHHHHHRQNVTPAYRRDTTHSKPAIRAIETKEYLPSIARETERETERQRDRVKNGNDSDERRRKGEIGATWVASFGVRLWGRRVRDNQRLAVLMVGFRIILSTMLLSFS